MWLNTPSYALLFADMDDESAGQVVTRLEEHEGALSARRGRTRDSRPAQSGRRAAPRADGAGPAVERPHRLRDLRPHDVRRHRFRRAGELSTRARGRNRANHQHDRRSGGRTRPHRHGEGLALRREAPGEGVGRSQAARPADVAVRAARSQASRIWSPPASRDSSPTRSSSSTASAGRCRARQTSPDCSTAANSSGSSGSSTTCRRA